MDTRIFEEAETVDIFHELSEADKAEAKVLADIAMALHNKRVAMGLNQKEFGKLYNVSQTVASRWESGEYNFTIHTLINVLTNLGISIQLVDKETEEQTKKVSAALENLIAAYTKSKTA